MFIIVPGLLALLMSGPAPAMDRPSTILLNQAIEAQGGKQKLRSIKSVQWDAFGYRNELEESERPEGPYVTKFNTISEVHDFSGIRYRSTACQRAPGVCLGVTFRLCDIGTNPGSLR